MRRMMPEVFGGAIAPSTLSAPGVAPTLSASSPVVSLSGTLNI